MTYTKRQEKQVARAIDRLRKMVPWQRYMVLGWLKDWEAYLKEYEEE